MDGDGNGGSTLARISDPRARQFWDRKHIVSQELKRVAQQHPGAEAPPWCEQRGFYWDDVILYAPRGSWRDAPTHAYWNGLVVRMMPDLEKALHDVN
jgi:hypothetical protein